MTFAGTTGQDLTLNVSALTLSGTSPYLSFTVYRPDGTTYVTSGTCYPTGNGCTVTVYGLPVTGTYSIVYTPYPGSATGSFTLKAWASSRVTGALTVGTASTLSTTVPGQIAQYTFSGTAGQQLGLALSNFTTSVAGAQLYAIVNKPDGSNLLFGYFTASQTTPTAYTYDLPVLPTTGTYTVMVYPYQTTTSTMTTTFSGQVLVSADVAAVLATNGTATNIALAQPGQQARVTFAGTTGQDLTLNVSALTLSGTSPYLSFTVYRPDGTTYVTSGTCYPTGNGCTVTVYGLPVTGTYSIVYTPYPGSATGSFTLKAWASSRVTGALTVGTASTLSTTVPGQIAQYTFSGTAGQQLGLALSNFTTSVAGAQLYAIVNKPDGSNLLFGYFTASQTTPTAYTYDLPVLPTTGTYTVMVYPYQTTTSTMTTTFSGQVLVSADVAAVLATNGTATNIALAQPGQQARVTFAGTTGQDLTLNVSALTLSGTSPYLSFTVYRPDGTTYVTSGTCYPTGNGCTVTVYGLPVTGTYSIVYTPYPGSATGSFTLKAWASSRVTGALTVGTASTLSTTVPGQIAQYTFSGTAGQQLGLALSNFTTSVAGAQLYAIVNKPDGSNLLFGYFTASQTTPTAYTYDLPVLPTTGTYTVMVYPYQTTTSTMTTTFSGQVLVSADVAAVLATNGTATNIALAQPGQQARVTFAGTTGQDLTLNVSALTLSGTSPYLSFTVYRPDGTTYVTSGTCYPTGNGCTVTVYGLPVTGTYSIVYTPYPGSATGSFTLKAWASSRVTGALTVGTASTLSTTVPGQIAQYTFSGTAGQQLGLALSNFTTSVAGAQLYAIVNKPDGSNLLFGYFTASQTTPTAYTYDLPVLPTTGTYTVMVYPYQTTTSTMTTTFSGQVRVYVR